MVDNRVYKTLADVGGKFVETAGPEGNEPGYQVILPIIGPVDFSVRELIEMTEAIENSTEETWESIVEREGSR